MKHIKMLSTIQKELKAPKGQFNSFGKYKYRSCEDIIEALKPLLATYDAAILLNDEVVEIGGRVYVKATASIYVDAEYISNVGYAREPEDKKGMDASQITGTASSYARKYALNGLLAIDDTKDADTDEHANQIKAAPAKRINKKLVQKYVQGFIDAIEAGDALAMKELGDELKDTPEHSEVWGALDSSQKKAVKDGIYSLSNQEQK